MVTTIDTITTPNWQLSTKGLGEVALDGDDILMSIHNILFTFKGEVPFSPEKGSNLFKLVDLPINKIGAAVSSEFIDAVTKREKRVAIASANFTILNDQSVVWDIKMVVKASSATLVYSFNLSTDKENRRAFNDGFTTEAFA